MTESTDLAHELLELEHRFWRALQDNDARGAMELTDESCIIIGAQGVMLLKPEDFVQIMQSAQYTLHRLTIDEPQVQRVSDDVAVIAYQAEEELTVEGGPVTLRAADSSVWVRRGRRWLCAMHTETLLGDPFGRDRRALN